ncbi:NAD(P)-binding protein [Saccharata proteae CBS 121410]|uniref:NAD(P)-binding protein n=1 Tax=Saccharata proteae CBS 121410 TaxID=1314787 RepID=A0A9P4HTV2_9PEZI|nr:NAD(P)-binding protein [Saccharata proteae CBS 121410]
MTAVVDSVPYSVDGRTAIVTGGGSGISLSFATLLLRSNCNVVIADLALRPEAETLISLHTTTTPRAIFVRTDVTSWPQLTNMFAVARAEFGGFDILCPGAGVYEPRWSNFWHPPGTASSKDPVDAEPGHYASIDINLTHPIRCTQMAIAEWLNPRGDGAGSSSNLKASPLNQKRVIHISSVAGHMAFVANPLYIACKHGIHGFVRSLARLDAGLGIRVIAVAPGLIKTPIWTEHPEKLAYRDESRDVWATPEEVAEAMLRCVVEEGMVGGTIVEVGKGNTRVVEAFNDPGPSRDPKDGFVASNSKKGTEEVFGWLQEEGWGTPGWNSAN